MKILVTGASGFIGSFIVEEALKRGFDTWAAMRKSSKKDFLTDPKINFLELNLDSEEQLQEQLRGHDFDYVVHAAGVTKCLNNDDFYRINTEGTKHLVNALLKLQMPIKRFVYISSLSIFGAIREQQPYEEIRESDTPQPNTHYGRSKLEAERWLDRLNADGPRLPYVVLRPTGVYGPRERDYFMMAKSIKQHSDFAVGYQQQDITFVYVMDVVQAVPGLRTRTDWAQIFSQRRKGLPVGHLLETHPAATGQSVVDPHHRTRVAVTHHHMGGRQDGPPDWQDNGAEQRQIPHSETAQLEVRHTAGHRRTGLPSGLHTGAGRAADHQMVP